MVYSSFNYYKDCFADVNFLCENHRCISILLYCDGYNHCGDNSDEPIDCKRRVLPSFMGYFYDMRTTALIFVICSLGN